ncbi:MAG: regulatory protein RecX [Sporomusaceae bacterium]|nr:regulatory protein RecX [Sporomusaceae bacterium]
MTRQLKTSALAAAVKLLARRAHSRQALRDKLAQRAYPADEIDAALTRLSERGYLNDTAYCADLAASLWQSGRWGRQGVIGQLRRHGLPMPLIRDMVNSLDRQQELPHALSQLDKRGFASGDKAKAARFLDARGFSFGVIEQALDRFFGDCCPESGEDGGDG